MISKIFIRVLLSQFSLTQKKKQHHPNFTFWVKFKSRLLLSVNNMTGFFLLLSLQTKNVIMVNKY